MGHATNYQYDQYGDLTEVDLPAVMDPVWEKLTRPAYHYGYDARGDLVSETVPDPVGTDGGDTTTYGYDAQGRKISETLPSVLDEATGQYTTPTESWSYNAPGQLTTFVDFDGDETDYAYYGTGSTLGAPGQLQSKTVYAPGTSGMDGMGGTPPTLYETTTYEYHQDEDGDGSYADIVIDSLAGTTTTTYNVEGQVRQVASPQGTIDYAYDPATGAEIEMYTLDSSSNHVTDITYAYNDLGQMTGTSATWLDGVQLTTPLTTTYTYDGAGELKTTTLPNGTVETQNYDVDGRVSSTSTVDGSTTVFSADYTRDANGDITRDVELLNSVNQEFDYSYDPDGRLTQETIDQGAATPRTLAWTYSLSGNRFEGTDSAATGASSDELYSYNADGELTDISEVGGGGGDPGMSDISYTYDTAGNQTSMSDSVSGTSSTSTWTPTGLLATYASGGTTVTYAYDANGERVSEKVGTNNPTTYLNDPTSAYDQALEEYAPSGVLAATYVRGVNLLFQDRAGVQSYYVTDQLGSVRALTDSTGAVTDTMTYDAYGNMISQTGTAPNEYFYAGMMLDAATGQYYDHARNYDETTGTFTSRDSYDGSTSNPNTLNHYAYAGINPTDNVDPTGHTFLGTMIAASAIGFVAGGTIGYIGGGAEGLVYGALSGAILAPVFTASAIGGGIATSATLLYFDVVFSPQVATFVIGTAFAAYNANSIRVRLNALDMSDLTAQRQMAAADTELAFTLIGWAIGAAALGRAQYIRDVQAKPLRAIYRAAAAETAKIGSANQNSTGAVLESVARQVYGIRHQARLAVRGLMRSWLDLRTFQLRDLIEYGNPDGPTFDFLVKKAIAMGFSGDDVYRSIIDGSARTNAAIDSAFKSQPNP